MKEARLDRMRGASGCRERRERRMGDRLIEPGEEEKGKQQERLDWPGEMSRCLPIIPGLEQREGRPGAEPVDARRLEGGGCRREGKATKASVISPEYA
jgi:hypothetical protein